MLPLLGGILSGGLGLMGNLLGTSANNRNAVEMQQQAQQFNSSQTLQQQQFQEQMSSSAYQRASKDMTAAGLNPMMMFGSGSSASTPAGAAATTQPAQKTSALTTIGPAMDRIVSSAISAKTFDKLTDEIANLKSTNEFIQAKTATERKRPALVSEETFNKMQKSGVLGLEIGVLRNKAREAANEEAFRSTPAGRLMDQGALAGRKGSQILAPVGDIISSAGGVVRAMRGLSAHNFQMRWP